MVKYKESRSVRDEYQDKMNKNSLISALCLMILPVAVCLIPRPVSAAASVADAVKGRILLDVEGRGEAWYVSPVSGLRYSLGSPDRAFRIMTQFGVGIVPGELDRIAVAGSAGSTPQDLRPYVDGRILIDAHRKGEAWYVDPVDGSRHALRDPREAFRTMARLGLGITASDLSRIPVGEERGTFVDHAVPFTPQAPFAEWWDRRQNEGCEEASAFMAVSWANGMSVDAQAARDAILGAAEYQKRTYGSYEDTSVADTATRIFIEYFGFKDIAIERDIGPDDILREVRKGNSVVVGVDGSRLGNPFFGSPPPVQHMVVVHGFDPLADAFIVNDPGTRKGRDIRYRYSTFGDALLDYRSGYREPIPESRPASMIVVRPAPLRIASYP